MLLVVEVCVSRDVKVVGVGNVASLFFARAFVWGDVVGSSWRWPGRR